MKIIQITALIIVIIVGVLFVIYMGTIIAERIECEILCEESDLDYFKYEPSEKACYCEALAPNIIKMDMNKSSEVSENAT